jgi:hypothetical protein
MVPDVRKLGGVELDLETVAPNQFAYGEAPLRWTHMTAQTFVTGRQTSATAPRLSVNAVHHTPRPFWYRAQLQPHSIGNATPLASASQLWSFKPSYSMVGSPVLANGLVYFTSGNSGTGSQAFTA